MSPATNQACARVTVTTGRAAARIGTLHLQLMIVALVAVAVNAAVDGAAFVYLLVVTVAASGSMTALALKGYIAVVAAAVAESENRRAVAGPAPAAPPADGHGPRQTVIIEQAMVMPDDEGMATFKFTASGHDLRVAFHATTPPNVWACPPRVLRIPNAAALEHLVAPPTPPSKGIEPS